MQTILLACPEISRNPLLPWQAKAEHSPETPQMPRGRSEHHAAAFKQDKLPYLLCS